MQKPGRPRGRIGKRIERNEVAGIPGASPLEALKDVKFEATRNSIAGRAWRCRMRG